MNGKTIRLYIHGDDFKNLKTAELSNWSGKCYLGKRKHTKVIQIIEELLSPGIYFLFFQNETSVQKSVYIGEADEVNRRINDHFRNKEWWEDFVIFISKDANLTKAHVRYLEKRFYQIAKENTTAFDLKNSSEPSGSKLPNSDIDELEEFLVNMIYVMQNLGVIDFARTKEEVLQTPVNQNEIFYINHTTERIDRANNVLKAKMIMTQDGYRLLKGSFIEKEMRQSFEKHPYYPLRQKIESEKYFEESDYPGCWKLNKDIDFNSPSAAASIVKNRATNGRKEWKLVDGMTLDDFENKIN